MTVFAFNSGSPEQEAEWLRRWSLISRLFKTTKTPSGGGAGERYAASKTHVSFVYAYSVRNIFLFDNYLANFSRDARTSSCKVSIVFISP
jgi:hypothetical protein